MKKYLALLFLLALPAFSQSLTLLMPSGITAPGTSATVNVQLTNSTVPNGLGITALQFNFVTPSDIGQVAIVAGPAATAAGKQLSCNLPVPSVTTGANGICLVWGLNNTQIGDGVVAIATVPVNTTAKLGNETIGLSLAAGADANGSGVSIASMGGSFPVFSGCDLDRNGIVDIADVNLVVAQVIAGPGGCSSGDLNKDGKCSVLDVYREVVAALPASSGVTGAGVCKVGP